MFQITSTLRRHWKPLIALNTVLIGSTALIAAFYPRTWQASARFVVPINTNQLSADIGTLGQLRPGDGVVPSDLMNPVTLQAEIVKSPTLIGQVLAVDPERDQHTLQSFMPLFEAKPQSLSPLMTVEVKGTTPELAHQRLSTWIKLYQKRLTYLRENDASTRQTLPQQELQEASNNLRRTQTQLSVFRQANNITDINEQIRGLVNSISDLKTEYARALAQAQASNAQQQALSQHLRLTPQAAMTTLRLGENKEYQLVRDRLAQVEADLATARGTLTDDNPRVQDLLEQRQKLTQLLDQNLRAAIGNSSLAGVDRSLAGSAAGDSRIALIADLIRTQSTANGQQSQAQQLQQQLGQQVTALNRLSNKQVQLLELQREYSIAEGVYKGVMAQFQQAKISTLSSYPSVQVLDGPLNSPRPEPRRMLIILGGLMAIAFGSSALVLLLESRNPLLSPADIQKVKQPILAKLPRLKAPSQVWNLDAEPLLGFHRLASAISFLDLATPRLMITSAMYGEGKTTIAIGLAAALARLGFKILLVDGDLRRARLTEQLSDRYQGSWNPRETAVVPLSPGLDLMPAPAIPNDRIVNYVAKGGFEQQLQTLQQSGEYDYVLVDTAPITLTSETGLMTTSVNNLLFVVRPGTSSRYSVLDSFEELSLRKVNVVGVTINGIETNSEEYYYGKQRELAATEL
uniref:Lipopolysaccharide biosynthesis protein n=1 Tax=Cyanothece sp. (strain PCC 7425 / ATCC 29141) TaxID=395961 RepID=B8HQ70_CYAP4